MIDTFFKVSANILNSESKELLQRLQRETLPALAISPYDLARIAVGCFLFLMVSSILTSACISNNGASLNTFLEAGIVGPLRFVLDDSDEEAERLAWSVALLIVLRGLLCTFVVWGTWYSINEDSYSFFYAMMLNDDAKNSPFPRWWCILVFLHSCSGLVATSQFRAAAEMRALSSDKKACLGFEHMPSQGF